MRRPALAALFLLPLPALAQEAPQGRFALDPAGCDRAADDGVVTIEGDRIRFYESACTLTNPLPVRAMDGAVLFDAQCSAEGMTESRRLLLLPLADGGLGLAQGGLVARYARCGD